MPTKKRNQPKQSNPPDVVDRLTSMQAAIDSLNDRVDQMNQQADDNDNDSGHPDLVWDVDLAAYVEDWGDGDEEEEVLQAGQVQ